MLEVICFKWGTQYTADHVNVLQAMLARHLTVPHRLNCITDKPAGLHCRTIPLPETVKGAKWDGRKRRYIKLWAYSAEIGEHLEGDRLLLLDLDIVITGNMDALVQRDEPIVFWDDPHQATPYNSSVVLMGVGARRQVWDAFDPDTSPKECERSKVIGHDQCWAGLVLGPDEATWTKADGVLSMRNDVMGKKLPGNARIVVFHGNRDPSEAKMQKDYPWIARHWRHKRALVIGSGDRVAAELRRVNRDDFDVVIGVNAAGVAFGPVDYHVTLHPETYAKQKAGTLVSHKKREGVDIVTDHHMRKGGKSGSSGLFGVKFALIDLGCSEVTIAGIGLDFAPHFNRPDIWNSAKGFRQAWVEALPQLKGKVTSLGGWTAELLDGHTP